MALGTIAAVGGIASGVSSLVGGIRGRKAAKKGAAEQREMGRINAANIAAETEEELRRYDAGVEKTMSSGRAVQAASGFASGGSQDIYLAAMNEEFAADREWMQTVGQQRQDVALRTGEYTARSLEDQGRSALYQGLGGMFGGVTTAAGYLA